MPEPVTVGAILLLLKAIGAKAIIGKVALAIKGLVFTAKGKGLLLLAKQALVMAKTYSLLDVALAVGQMLIIVGTVAAGTELFFHAEEALRCFSSGDFKNGFAHAAKAGWRGHSVHTGLS